MHDRRRARSRVAARADRWFTSRVFTGLVVAVGSIVERSARGGGLRLAIEAPLAPYRLGESLAVSGACLTVTAAQGSRCFVDVSEESLRVTTLAGLTVGSRVNLERALRMGDPLGGHLCTGHVDGVGRVTALDREGTGWRLEVACPEALLPLIAPKGSITVDGVSLTVNAVDGDRCSMALIPHTREVTTLGSLLPGQAVNLEVDLLARYVARWLETRSGVRDATLRALLERLPREGNG